MEAKLWLITMSDMKFATLQIALWNGVDLQHHIVHAPLVVAAVDDFDGE
jgi:hypothetical protein